MTNTTPNSIHTSEVSITTRGPVESVPNTITVKKTKSDKSKSSKTAGGSIVNKSTILPQPSESKDESNDDNIGFETVVTKNLSKSLVVIPSTQLTSIEGQAFVAVPKKVVEIEKIYEVDEVIEIPEYHYVEEIVEVEEEKLVHRTIETPVETTVEKVKKIYVDVIEEVIIEVPQIQYTIREVENTVEVPTKREVTRVVEKAVPIHKEIITEHVTDVHKTRTVERKIPVPVEATLHQNFVISKIQPEFTDAHYEVLLPEFHEFACHRTGLTTEGLKKINNLQSRINQASGLGLCEAEELYVDITKEVLVQDAVVLTKERIIADLKARGHNVNADTIQIGTPIFKVHKDTKKGNTSALPQNATTPRNTEPVIKNVRKLKSRGLCCA